MASMQTIALGTPTTWWERSRRSDNGDGCTASGGRGARVCFQFTSCSFQLPRTGRRILSGVSATVKDNVLAIVGPSGAGKSTLLNVLRLSPAAGAASGTITLNGIPFTHRLCRAHSALVAQSDALWSFLTPRQHVAYAVELYQSSLSAAARQQEAHCLLAQLGLESCADTVAGNALVKGLSGGQRRRLSLAVALAKKPRVIFADEPTSGLDAAGAAHIMRLLGVVARGSACAVLCTIHQPSRSVFAGFDQALVLSLGRTAYCGPASAMAAHLASIGKPVPPNTNAADHMLDLVNRDFTDAQTVDAVLGALANCSKAAAAAAAASSAVVLRGSSTALLHAEDVHRPHPNGCICACAQIGVLLRRTATLAWRDPVLYLLRAVMLSLLSSFFCVVYLDSRVRDQQHLHSRQFLLWWVSAAAPMLGILVVAAQHADALTVKRELRDGFYRPLAFVVANTLIQLPMMCCLVPFVLVPAYTIGDWPWPSFPRLWLVFTATVWAFEAFAQVVSLESHLFLGAINFLNAWLLGLLVNGFVVAADRIVWPFRALAYLLPLRWAAEAGHYVLMIHTPEYAGTRPCPDTEYTREPSLAVLANVTVPPQCEDTPAGHALLAATLGQRDFYCPHTAPQSCWGASGPQILRSLEAVHDCFSAEDHVMRDVLFIAAWGLLFKLIYAARLASIRGGKAPEAPLLQLSADGGAGGEKRPKGTGDELCAVRVEG